MSHYETQSLLRMSGRFVWLLNALFGRSFRFRKSSGRGQCCTIMVERRVAFFLQIEDSTKIDVRPRYDLGFTGRGQRTLEIAARPGDVLVDGRNLREDEQGATLIFIFIIQGLLRQLLSAFWVARRKLLLGA